MAAVDKVICFLKVIVSHLTALRVQMVNVTITLPPQPYEASDDEVCSAHVLHSRLLSSIFTHYHIFTLRIF